ncbi:MAG: serine/threonine-protein kinase [Acidobacteriota bacterium]
MGEVYKAEDLKLNQTVALKFLPEQIALDGGMLARFHNEVRIARQVAHPNVCRVYDIGEVEGLHFISMEFIDGEDLSSLLRRIGRLPGDKAVEIARQLCAGLAAAHELGILHRDLKPANVMIDGRGKARITDFGLAVVSEELREEDVLAGTPAYMAPEQLTGKEVTHRSDIYSLGLVLYELFTGKRVYETQNIHELIELHDKSSPATPSSHVKDIDPLAERVILRCLDKDPKARPASAVQVALALPGGDPLQAALAMGETPSPEMVAASSKEGALRPAIAGACFAATLLVLALILFGSKYLSLNSKVALQKSPEVLAERAGNIINKLGYLAAPTDTAYGFAISDSYLKYEQQNPTAADARKSLASGQPLTIYFWYRQSPRYLEPINPPIMVWLNDPPLDVPGMTSLILDQRGRLVEFQGVPPQVETTEIHSDGATVAQAVDWSPLFAEAGLSIASFTVTASQWTPPVYADARAAWQGSYADHPDIPIRIEAAAWRGQPVYFQIVAPWDKPRRQEEALIPTGLKIAAILRTIVFAAILLGALLLARRNLRLGRGDRRGAFKLGLFIFSISLLGLLLAADHVPTFTESSILYEVVSSALFDAVLFGIIYLALEPFVRRYWPRLLISWTRLLAGEFRDPMIGRDVLIGGLLGLIGLTGMIYVRRFLSLQHTPNADMPADFDGGTLVSFGHLIAYFLGSVPRSITFGLGFLFLLLLLYILLRKKWLAAGVMGLLFYTIPSLVFTGVWFSPPVMIMATLIVVTVARFGLLATMAYSLFGSLTIAYPLTTDLSIWYAPNSLFALAVLVALSGYGYYTSLGGQKVFKGKLLEE